MCVCTHEIATSSLFTLHQFFSERDFFLSFFESFLDLCFFAAGESCVVRFFLPSPSSRNVSNFAGAKRITKRMRNKSTCGFSIDFQRSCNASETRTHTHATHAYTATRWRRRFFSGSLSVFTFNMYSLILSYFTSAHSASHSHYKFFLHFMFHRIYTLRAQVHCASESKRIITQLSLKRRRAVQRHCTAIHGDEMCRTKEEAVDGVGKRHLQFR